MGLLPAKVLPGKEDFQSPIMLLLLVLAPGVGVNSRWLLCRILLLVLVVLWVTLSRLILVLVRLVPLQGLLPRGLLLLPVRLWH